MSGLFTRMFRGVKAEPLSIGAAASAIVDAGHELAQLHAENARLRAALARHGADAPKHLQVMREHGWVFTFEPATRFIGGEHARGGRCSIAEMSGLGVGLTTADRNAFGAFIAAALNGR
jgi:hypothetical protein